MPRLPDHSTPLETLRALSRQRVVFALLFSLGTMIASLGWFVDWKQIHRVPFLYKHAAIIAVVGHAMQVVGTFGMLLTPDYREDDGA